MYLYVVGKILCICFNAFSIVPFKNYCIKVILMIYLNAFDCIIAREKRRTFSVYVPPTFDGRELRFQLFLLIKNATAPTQFTSPLPCRLLPLWCLPSRPPHPKTSSFQQHYFQDLLDKRVQGGKRGAGVMRWSKGSCMLRTCHADRVILKRGCLKSCRALDMAIRLMVLLL